MVSTIYYLRRRKGNKGQAIVEISLLLLVICVVCIMVIWFGFAYAIKNMLIVGARYGTDLIAYTDKLSDAEIKDWVERYLCHEKVMGIKLNPSNLEIEVSRKSDPFSDKKKRIVTQWIPVVESLDDTSYVEVSYKFPTPALFRVFGASVPQYITITERSEVVAGTGASLR